MDSGKFLFLDSVLPKMKEKVKFHSLNLRIKWENTVLDNQRVSIGTRLLLPQQPLRKVHLHKVDLRPS